MAQSLEARNSKEEKASRTWLMAKALEGDGTPTMRLRDSAFEQDEDDADEKMAECGPPRRMAQSLMANNKEEKASRTRQMVKSLEGDRTPRMRLRDSAFEQDEDYDADEKKVPEGGPSRRKPHPMSERFVGTSQDLEQARPQHTIHKLPPGVCCARCTRPSPMGSAAQESDFFAQVRQTGADDSTKQIGPARVSDFFAQVRHMNTKEAIATGSSRVSDFFAQVRQINTSEKNTGNDTKPSDKNNARGTSSDRLSDFFAKVREGKIPEAMEVGSNRESVETSTTDRESDFFAQVRQMTGNQPHPEHLLCEECQVKEFEGGIYMMREGLSRPVEELEGGFYGGVSPLNQTEERSDALHPSVSPMNVEDHLQRDRLSKVEDFEGAIYSGVSPLNQTWETSAAPDSNASPSRLEEKLQRERLSMMEERLSRSVTTPGQQSRQGEDDDAKSDHSRESTLSDLWKKGRSSFNAFSSSLNAISESKQRTQTTINTADSSPANLKGRASNVSERVSGFFQGLQGEQEDNNDEHDRSALAAFRKAQEEKRDSMTPDDSSSLSSYRVLPADIREVVQKMSSSSAASRPTAMSPSRSAVTYSSTGDVSPEKYKQFHDKVIRNSALLGDAEQEKFIIDTDGTTSDASDRGMDPQILARLMLSPDLLMQRLHQAIRAVEEKQWEQVTYLINANPWLAEMSESTTNQYLLHKLAFFGSGGSPAPQKLCNQLLDMFPAAVHKFDQDGNVPLHLAAASGHLKMIKMLGEKFESGASIRNEDGMLPLHFTIASYGGVDGAMSYGEEDDDDDDDENPSPVRVIKTVLKFFPKAVAIADNDGNLPLHVAVECLEGGVGVDVIYVLLDEADRQLQDPYGARFCSTMKLEDLVRDDISAATMSTELTTDSGNVDGDIHCNMAKNDFGETPLLSAIRARKGWEIIEAIVGGPGGRNAALQPDAGNNNALHLLVSECQDPAAAMSILKVSPETATVRNSEGMLPIEVSTSETRNGKNVVGLCVLSTTRYKTFAGGMYATDARRSDFGYRPRRSAHRHQ
jgi:ankyrin repeat protein